MPYTISFYDDDEIRAFLDGLPRDAGRAATFKLRLLEQLGYRLAAPHSKPIGEGVFEIRVDKGPGYRLYYCFRGDVIWLLRCGTKRNQQEDIAVAKARRTRLEGR